MMGVRATVELLVPPATGEGPRALTLDPHGLVPTILNLAPADTSVGITPLVPEFPSTPIAVFPELFRRVSTTFFESEPDELSATRRAELEWLVAEVVLEAPRITLETDGRDARDGYTITELVLDQDGVIWEGRSIVDHASHPDGPRTQPVAWNVDCGRYYLDPLPSAGTRWDAWPLPRLQTPRSLRAMRGGGANPSLQSPGVSRAFWRAYMLLFLQNATHRATAHRFLGGERMPQGVYRLAFAKPDQSTSMSELVARPSFDASKTMSMRHPTVTAGDDWLVDRILNGMHPCLFERHEGDHRGQPETQYRVTFNWNHLAFARVARRRGTDPLAALGVLGPPAADELEKLHYELPNAQATLALVNDALVLRSISLQHRKRLAPGTHSEPLPGPVVSADQLEDQVIHRPPSDALGGAEREHAERTWDYAKRAFRCQLALAGELDVHLAGAHLMTEQLLAALVSTSGMPRTESKVAGHPVWELLWPHLREVERINAFGNTLIFGVTGVLTNASALADASVGKRLLEQLGRRDWKGFAPRSKLCATHRYAVAANACWGAIVHFVRAAIDDRWSAIDQRWEQCERFADQLRARSPRYRPYRGLSSETAWEEGSRSELSFKPVGAPSMSTLPRGSAPADERKQDLVQLCSYAIFHATFVHTWANDRQFEDLGDARYASLGLMTREPPPRDPSKHAAWEERARPLLRDAGFTMSLARILSQLDVGMLLSRNQCPGSRHPEPEDNPVDAALTHALMIAKSAYESGDDPFEANRSKLDAALVCSLRSHINT